MTINFNLQPCILIDDTNKSSFTYILCLREVVRIFVSHIYGVPNQETKKKNLLVTFEPFWLDAIRELDFHIWPSLLYMKQLIIKCKQYMAISKQTLIQITAFNCSSSKENS